MANAGYSDDVHRLDPGGPTGVQRRSMVMNLCDVDKFMQIDSVANEFARKGWNKYEVPTTNTGDRVEDKGFPMPGGNAGANGQHITADYPGGTVA